MFIKPDIRQNWKKLVINLLKKEVWCLHPNYNLYLISNFGRIQSLRTNKILKPFVNKQGYNMVKIYDGGIKTKSVHKLVMETFLNHFNNKHNMYEVNHMDGNKSNNSLKNLEWMTRSENLKHAKILGLNKRFKGEDNASAKLSNNDIIDIRELNNLGFHYEDLAKSYKISRTHMYEIVKGNRR